MQNAYKSNANACKSNAKPKEAKEIEKIEKIEKINEIEEIKERIYTKCIQR
jgi:hypothetical protein